MANNKIDISKLKSEIENRKKEKHIVSTNLGESIETNTMPRDTFLNELLTSLEKGVDTGATNRLKLVENAVAEKQGEVVKYNVKQNVDTRTQPTTGINVNEERDELLFKQFEKKRNDTLANSLERFSNIPQQASPHARQYNNNTDDMLKIMSKLIDEKLAEGLENIVEIAMKNVIFEIYSTEKIKETITENKDIVKKIVLDTIVELQRKRKNS